MPQFQSLFNNNADAEMKHLKETMETLSSNVVINIPSSIKFTKNLTNLKYIKLKS